ncbi:hypothetical protein AAF712_012316 [Marasmius tenuissimus]|uniref:NmrA-like domain-containing protein n=1 Tax=Marasmius tenuissimus TaxID=585030 RepID=A0ABR2ZK64_9AGAR
MPKSNSIAVAGGSGGIGRYIVEGLLALKASRCPHLHIIVLSRTKGDDISFQGAIARRLEVEYDDKEGLTSLFRLNRIDTIICTLANLDLTQFSALQEKVLRAALDVSSFRRFAPSEFSVDSEALKTYNYYACKLPILDVLRSVKSTHPNLEWTKPAGEKALEHLRKMAIRVDISNGTADIPGDGTVKQFYTVAEDVGALVAEATQLEAWPKQLDMAGDEISYNEIVSVAGKITGKKFNVTRSTREDVLKVMNQPPKGWKDYYYLSQLSVIVGETQQGKTLNGLVPNFKPTTVEEFINKWWGKDDK